MHKRSSIRSQNIHITPTALLKIQYMQQVKKSDFKAFSYTVLSARRVSTRLLLNANEKSQEL